LPGPPSFSDEAATNSSIASRQNYVQSVMEGGSTCNSIAMDAAGSLRTMYVRMRTSRRVKWLRLNHVECRMLRDPLHRRPCGTFRHIHLYPSVAFCLLQKRISDWQEGHRICDGSRRTSFKNWMPSSKEESRSGTHFPDPPEAGSD
jgi:hypothetical protein